MNKKPKGKSKLLYFLDQKNQGLETEDGMSDKKKYIFSHEPVYLNPGSNFYNIHGHTHQFPVDANYFNRDCENWAMMEVVKKYMVTKQKNLDIDTSVKPSYKKTVDPDNYIDVCWDYYHKILPFEEIIQKC